MIVAKFSGEILNIVLLREITSYVSIDHLIIWVFKNISGLVTWRVQSKIGTSWTFLRNLFQLKSSLTRWLALQFSENLPKKNQTKRFFYMSEHEITRCLAPWLVMQSTSYLVVGSQCVEEFNTKSNRRKCQIEIVEVIGMCHSNTWFWNE